MLLLWSLLVACVPPTIVGVRTDGYLAPAGSLEFSAGYGGSLPALDLAAADPVGVPAGEVAWSATDDVQVSVGAAFPEGWVMPGAEIMVRVIGAEDTPVDFAVLTGVGGIFSGEPATLGQVGVHVGGVVSVEAVPDLRPFVGAVGAVAFAEGEPSVFGEASLGIGWRPKVSDEVSLLFLAEAAWIHGSDLADEAQWTYDALSAAGMAGLTWNPKKGE